MNRSSYFFSITLSLISGFIWSSGNLVPLTRPQNQGPEPAPHLQANETYITVFRHGYRADSYAQAEGQLNHDPGIAPAHMQTQLEDSIDELIWHNIRPTIIISSPYLRSVQTARRIQARLHSATGEFAAIFIDRRLGEWAYAAFGRYQLPISPVRNHGHFDITPANWNEAVLSEEMSLESGIAYTNRINGVLNELAGRYLRPLVVGHLHTITALYPEQERPSISQEGVPQGFFAIGRLTNDETPVLTLERRISPPKKAQ